MDTYIGTKLIKASPAIRKGGKVYTIDEAIPKTMDQVEEGYKVVYPDGYESWSPREVFEAAYMKVGDNNSIVQETVDRFIMGYQSFQLGDKTTVVKATLINGFVIVESSSCVDAANYDHEVGTNICLDRIKNKVWELLGFLLQTAVGGVKI